MSVFEDLIDELKNENLLEQTVIDVSRAATPAAEPGQGSVPSEPEVLIADRGAAAAAIVGSQKSQTEHEFFRKRAIDEVSNLQMVEHVFSGVEREYLHIAPEPFDDLEAKKALHKFLQLAVGPSSPEHAEAEFELRNETEAWNLALSARDQKISVSSIRQFCEESRPALSSSALIALARFYRNSPYSEDVRGKFDYVMTRLFSRETGDGRRQMLFDQSEMIEHINTLYADWSSIALYSSEDDRNEISLTVTRFGEFVEEATRARAFSELLGSEFFNRLRSYKEDSAEMFYVTDVLAAAMHCNLTVGNRYVELIALERERRSAEKVEERYGSEFDQLVSNAAGKTLNLNEVLALDIDLPEQPEPRQPAATPAAAPEPPKSKPKNAQWQPKATTKVGRIQSASPAVNKYLALLCAAMILAGVGIYVWAERFAGGGEGDASIARPVEIEVPDAGKFLKNARFTNETLYAVTLPAFDTLTESEQRELIGKIQQFAASKGLENVSLLNKEGRSVAFASNSRLELIDK